METLVRAWYNTRRDSLAIIGGKDNEGMENTYKE